MALIGAGGAMLVALAALLGMGTGVTILSSGVPGFIPMAPTTALCLLLLGAVLFLHAHGPLNDAVLVIAQVTVPVVFAVGLAVAVLPVAGVALSPHLRLMSPATGLGLCLFAVGLFLSLPGTPGARPGPRRGDAATSLGVLTAFLGALILSSHLWASPILYGSGVVPMAATTALGLVLLGGALVAAGGPERFPARLLVGDSTAARLSRVFIPLAVILALVQGGLARLAEGKVHEAFSTGLELWLVVAITSAVVARVAHSLGSGIDELHAENRALISAIPDLVFTNRADGEFLAVNVSDSRRLFAGPELFLHRKVEDRKSVV